MVEVSHLVSDWAGEQVQIQVTWKSNLVTTLSSVTCLCLNWATSEKTAIALQGQKAEATSLLQWVQKCPFSDLDQLDPSGTTMYGERWGREQMGQEGYAGDHLLLESHWCILSSPGNCTVGSAGEATPQRSTPLIRKCFSGWGKFISSSCWVKMQIRFSFCSGIGLDFTTLIPLRTKQMSTRRLEKCTGWIWRE